MARKPDIPATREVASQGASATDILVLIGLPILGTLSWLLPQSAWPRVCRVFAGIAARVQGQSMAGMERQIAAAVGGRPAALNPAKTVRANVACRIETEMQMLREYRPDGLRPKIDIEGLDHLTEALGRGRGAVLWVDYFAFANLLAKIAMHRAGHPLHHLSHPRHGYSETRFGMRWLNPVTARIENRYLAERVTLSLSSAARALRTLQGRLEAGLPVSFSARPTGSQVVETPFLDGILPLASGAPALAHSAGSTLLPLSVVRTAPGRYRAAIEPPLPLDPEAPRKEAVPAAAHAYARRLEPVVLRHPEQWQGWSMVLGTGI